ncbi:hypothetical protein AB205_0149080 [Aquarana catesbeiana]|uniref:Protein arginine N-methyltransferase domain-containing protein n=1 Tax=Aquarana catesbeiana TaxID=8400 RepID=A0A2G9S3T2_AQUCT|nr:hypothetical protein AB205_0149080 [Aquarana catesbeiana]
MEGQERCGDGLEKHRKEELSVRQKTEPEKRTETMSAATGVNDSPSCSMRDMDTKMCDCGMKPIELHSNCQLSLSYGDRVLLLSAVTPDWWWVEHNGNCGYVPASHLHKINDEDDVEDDDLWQDKEYYGSYKTLKLHLEMLSDQPRTQTYRNVILQNSSALKGKQILDLGCGTGIISFFCAQLAQPDVFEFMLESVLLARDLWLEEDGIMWPSTASIHMVPCSAEKEYATKVLFWDSAYGLNFKVLKSMAVQEFLAKPQPDYVLNPEDCLSEPCILLNINMKTLKIEELERMSGPFEFHVKRDGILHGFTSWFSVQFQNIENQGHVELHTGPFNP